MAPEDWPMNLMTDGGCHFVKPGQGVQWITASALLDVVHKFVVLLVRSKVLVGDPDLWDNVPGNARPTDWYGLQKKDLGGIPGHAGCFQPF